MSHEGGVTADGPTDGPRPLVRRSTPDRTRDTVLGAGFDPRLAVRVLLAVLAPVLVFAWLGRTAPVAPSQADDPADPAAAAVGVAAGADDPSGPAPSAEPAAPGPSPEPAGPAVATSRTAPPTPCPSVPHGAAVIRADTDGDGCAEAVEIDGDRLAVRSGVERVVYRVGEVGDQVLVGDWDCDGVATPALYRPDPGTVFTYLRWPSATEEVRPVTASATPGGTAEVRRTARCDALRISE